MQVAPSDAKKLKEIYERLNVLQLTEQGLSDLERHLDNAIKIVEAYGSNIKVNTLLNDLKQIGKKLFSDVYADINLETLPFTLKKSLQSFKWALVWYIN